MTPYSGRVAWGQGFCSLLIDDLDAVSWTGKPQGGMAVLSAGQPFPWNVRVVLLEGERAGDAADAQFDADPKADHAEFLGHGPFAPSPDEHELAIERDRLHGELKAATNPEEIEAIFDRLHRDLRADS